MEQLPADVDKDLQEKALEGDAAISCRPADLIDEKFSDINEEFIKVHQENSLDVEINDDNVLIYALFPEIGLNYFKNINNPNYFEIRPPEIEEKTSNVYAVTINDKTIEISVDEMDNITLNDTHKRKSNVEVQKNTTTKSTKFELNAPLAGNIFKIFIKDGEAVVKDQTLIILEAMKMETEIKSPEDGIVKQIHAKVGDSVNPGDILIEFS